jgi:tetratricopeptide (TPR) repeat protein
MVVQVREKTIEDMETKLDSMGTALNKIVYLESALKAGIAANFEIKRFIWGELARMYEERKMFERAARALGNLAALEPMFRERMDSYVMAAELFCRLGKINDAEDMFVRAGRDVVGNGKAKVMLARKNVYLSAARELESKGKRASAVKFYEKLVKMKLEDIERGDILEKLRVLYKALGMFREARLLGEK